MSDRVWTVVRSPVGELLLGATQDDVTEVFFQGGGSRPDTRSDQVRAAVRDDEHPLLTRVAHQLSEYFDGSRHDFDVPLAPRGSRFQQRVWTALTEIPYGATVSYGKIAERLGLPPGASRAVGLANGSNPISLVVPCHRVIGSDGTLTGYGGGIERKRWLLAHEGASHR